MSSDAVAYALPRIPFEQSPFQLSQVVTGHVMLSIANEPYLTNLVCFKVMIDLTDRVRLRSRVLPLQPLLRTTTVM